MGVEFLEFVQCCIILMIGLVIGYGFGSEKRDKEEDKSDE